MQSDEPELPRLEATYDDCEDYVSAWNLALSMEQESSHQRRDSQTVPNLKMRIWGSGTQWYGIFRTPPRCATFMARGTEVEVVAQGKASQRAFVTQINVHNEITVRFSSNLQSFVVGASIEQDSEGVSYVIECRVEVFRSDAIYRKLQAGLDRFSGDGTTETIRKLWLGQSVPFDAEPFTPIKDTFGDAKERYFRSRKLDDYQKGAVTAAMGSPICVIQGPAGTGKSTCIAAYVWNTVRQGRGKVLVTAPSSSAADQVCIYILNTGVNVVRLGGKKEEMDEFKPTDPRLQHVMVSTLVSQMAGEQADRLRALREKEEGEELTEEEKKEVKDLYDSLAASVCRDADVVCCTVASCGSAILGGIEFPRVVIDEVTQSTEVYALLPVCRGARQVVLVGDPLQLGPVVKNRELMRHGYHHSIAHRLVLLSQTLEPILLRIQYRMHPAVLDFPSRFFYHSRLKNGVNSQQCIADCKCLEGWVMPEAPLLFVHSETPEELMEGSFRNLGEIPFVLSVLFQLAARGIGGVRIGVMTPYQQQLLAIRSTLSDYVRSGRMTDEFVEDLSLGTISAFQGTEKDFMILSFVRSNPQGDLGFVGDPFRINVSITRARLGLFCTGNVKTLSRDPVWNAFFRDYRQRNLLWAVENMRYVPCPENFIQPINQRLAHHVEEVIDMLKCYDDNED